MDVDTLVEDTRWNTVKLDDLVHRALAATFADRGIDPSIVEVSILACDDARISVLNAEHREKPRSTNVLSWPAEDLSAEIPGDLPLMPQPGPDGVLSLGDIAIAFETCTREADNLAKPMTDHVVHLIIHGTLHLLGYDHVRDRDATVMQSIEAEILGKLGIDDPYSI